MHVEVCKDGDEDVVGVAALVLQTGQYEMGTQLYLLQACGLEQLFIGVAKQVDDGGHVHG
jgi:hypothetical protein